MTYIISLLLLISGLLTNQWVAPTISPCDQPGGNPPVIVQVFDLAYAVPEQPGHGKEDFLRQLLTFSVRADQRYFLASTRDGRGQLSVDDLVTLTIFPSGKTWSHDFRNQARTHILPIDPLDITDLLTPNVANTIELVATNLTPPMKGSRSFHIIVLACSSPAMATSLPTNTPAAVPTNTPVPTVIPTDTPVPTAPPATPTILAKPTFPPAIPPIFKRVWPPNMWQVVGSFGFIGLLLWVLFSLNVLRVPGGYDVYEAGQYQHSVNLADLGKRAVLVDQHGDVLQTGDSPGQAVIRFWVRRIGKEKETMVDIFDLNNPGTVIESRPIHDEEQINLGRRYLVYRNQAVSEEELVTFEELSDV